MKSHFISFLIFLLYISVEVNAQTMLARYDFNKTAGSFSNQSYLPSYNAEGVTFGGEFTEFSYTDAKVAKELVTTDNADCVKFTPSGTGANTGLLSINNRFHYITVAPQTDKKVVITKAIVRYKTVIGSAETNNIGIRCALRPTLDGLSANPTRPFTLGFPVCNTGGAYGYALKTPTFTSITTNTFTSTQWNPGLDYSFTAPVYLTFEFSGAVDGSNAVFIDWVEFWGDVVPVNNVTPTQKLYYIDPVNGNNTNKGDSPENPLRDIKNVHSSQFIPGTQILFKAGTYYNAQVSLNGVIGTAEEPIIISSYWDGLPASTPAATINGASYLSAVQIENCSFVHLKKLTLTANGGGFNIPSLGNEGIRCGVLVRTSVIGDYSDIHLSELSISDVFYQDPGYDAAGSGETDANGYGIRFYNQISNATLKNISVKNCHITNVGHTGLKINGGSSNSYIDSVEVLNNTITHVGGPGIQTGITRYARFAYNTVDHSGSSNDTRMWHRGSGLWTWGVYDVLVEHNSFTNANGPGDTAGSHIDYNCTNVVMQYNFSANNAGGFVEILGNNRNCSYRYNVSVNDGWRVKGVNGAFQEGKTLWLSGYVGAGDGIGPYNTYIYNNTIYVRSTMISKYSLESTSQGVLIANNIFHVLGNSASVLGDQTSTATRVKTDDGDVFFRNNIFLKTTNWPGAEKIEDAAPVYGDVSFTNAGGMKIEDYIPQNLSLVKGRGIAIPNLPGDAIGLKIGLKVTTDILGNPVGEVLDMGAIALSEPNSVKQIKSYISKLIPHSDGFLVTYEGDAVMTLFTINGQIVQTKRFSGAADVSCFKGMYIVKVNNEVHKIIVQ
ncbi:MAG: right-handed parallel beta-helix repeat-containing protein [Bacteroidales bacterium]|jgi:hypothetical protein